MASHSHRQSVNFCTSDLLFLEFGVDIPLICFLNSNFINSPIVGSLGSVISSVSL
eukprot:08405.XXX_383543_383707_1 [CDS] Oithona nana genome sequencing.